MYVTQTRTNAQMALTLVMTMLNVITPKEDSHVPAIKDSQEMDLTVRVSVLDNSLMKSNGML